MTPWNDPSSWPDGKVPGPDDKAIVDIGREIIFSGQVAACEVFVAPGARLIAAPSASSKLTLCGNFQLLGELSLRPSSAAVTHELLFTGIDESKFVGGGSDMLDSDIGLWVMEDGVLDAQGTDRVGWVAAPSRDPSWLPGDDVRFCPIAGGDASSFGPWYLDETAPSVVYDGVRYYAEAINLTRNVIIGGSGDGSVDPRKNGRTHVMFMMTRKPQVIRNVLIHNVGPRHGVPGSTTPVLGRWGLHFHKCEDASRGSLVENVVVRNCGSHSFVAHKSHGVTFRRCVSFNSWESAYWWDPDVNGQPPTLNQSDDTFYDHCLAALVQCDPPFRGFRAAGFELGFGRGNKAVGCVAVGVQGTTNASGFYWQDSFDARQFVTNPRQWSAPWQFEDCVAHNNAIDGLFVWQNKQSHDVIERFVAYRNGRAGVEHGAYTNTFTYDQARLYENGAAGFIVIATSHQDPDPTNRLRFRGCVVDGAGPAVVFSWHVIDLPIPYGLFDSCTFRSAGKVAVDVEENAMLNKPGRYAFLSCSFNGRPLALGDMKLSCAPNSSYVVQGASGQAVEVTERPLPAGWVP